MKPAVFIAVVAIIIKPIQASTSSNSNVDNPIVETSDDVTENNIFCEEDFANVTLCTNVRSGELIDPCRDTNEQCSYWASVGECKANPNYMLQSCAKSCDECMPFSETNRHQEDQDIFDTLNKRSELNVAQDRSIGNNKSEMKNTHTYATRMDEYRKALFQHPSTTSKTRKLCINELSKCTYYASLGLCEQRIIFMLETCPLACMMCEQKEQFDKCVGMRHPFDIPVFISDKEYDIVRNQASVSDNDGVDNEVKTIDSFFQSKKDYSKWFVDHSAEYINDPTKDQNNGDSSWIVKFDNVISSQECQSIINLGNQVGWKNISSEEDDAKSFISTKKKSSTDDDDDDDDDYDDKPKYSFKSAKCNSDTVLKCDKYTVISNILERISDLLQIPLEYFEPSEIIMYPELTGYQSLQHNVNVHDVWKIVGPRVLSLNIPLNSVEKGGYIGFPSLDWLMFQPKAGQLILWSNMLSNDPNAAMNENMANELLPIQEGNLYFLRFHVRQYDYESAMERGYEHCF